MNKKGRKQLLEPKGEPVSFYKIFMDKGKFPITVDRLVNSLLSAFYAYEHTVRERSVLFILCS